MNITVPKGLKKDEMYGYIKKELSKRPERVAMTVLFWRIPQLY